MPVQTPAALQRPAPTPLSDRVAWSIADSAKALGVSTRLVTRLIAEKKIPAAKLGRRTLLDPAAVRAAVFG
jgi:excisionase family DNA binding protein